MVPAAPGMGNNKTEHPKTALSLHRMKRGAGVRILLVVAGAAALPACGRESDDFGSPAIGLSATFLAFSADEGGAAPTDQIVQLSNVGHEGTSLAWTAVSDQPWLLVTPDNGTRGTPGSTPLTVSVLSTTQTEAWTGATTTSGAPTGGTGRGVWTGSAFLVWGDGLGQSGTFYDPAGDAWSGSTSTTDAPDARILFSAVWTGTEMIVWGGITSWGGTPLNTGGRYNPTTDTWTATSTVNAPSPRFAHTAVWTGSRMIVWGGDEGGFGYQNTGGIYDPTTNTWEAATTTTDAPTARGYHAAVWNGTHMIVWGGENPGKFNTGAFYDPVGDAWAGETNTVGAPSARSHLAAVWTGREMIVWGGGDGGPHLDTGGRYDPALDRWSTVPATDAPAGRASHTMAWTGSRMIVWGGEINGSPTSTGGLYRPPELPRGEYRGTITITAPGARNSPQTITVDLTVGP